jgi:hypothetical protein
LNPITGYALGLAASAFVAIYSANALYQLANCAGACAGSKSQPPARAAAPPPPLPQGSNTSAECTGLAEVRWEASGRWRKLPNSGFRGEGWIGHTNPCAVYFQVLEGAMSIGTDLGDNVRETHEGRGMRTTWPVHVDVVRSAFREPSRWKVIFCREWHPIMKEWKCR